MMSVLVLEDGGMVSLDGIGVVDVGGGGCSGLL